MPIKVIYQGTPKPVLYKGKCEGCGSVLECGDDDLYSRDADAVGPFGLATCPVCRTGMNRMMNVTFRPKADYDRLKKAGER